MSFSCGCHVLPGSDVTPEMLKAHLVHTVEAMLFWELLGRRTSPADRIGKVKLSTARQDFIEAVTALYPESVEQKDEAAV